jgi:hypothetical protein
MMAAVDTRVLSNRVSERNLFGACWLAIEHVSSKPESLVGFKMSKEVILIYDSSTRGIKKHCIRLHVRKEVLVDHVLCLSSGGSVDAHNITVLEKFLKTGSILETKLLLKTWLLCASMNDNIKIKSLCSLENKLCDSTKSNQAKSATLDSCAISKHPFVPFLLSQKLNTLGDTSIN